MFIVYHLTLIVALFVAIIGAASINVDFTASFNKGPKCHHPFIINCNSSLYPIMDFQEAGWFYHSLFKSCRPLYTAGGIHNCTGNQDLPLTKEECENLCGEPCKTGNGSDGICMLVEYCKPENEKTSAHRRPCGASNVKCCPPSNVSTNTEVEVSKPITMRPTQS